MAGRLVLDTNIVIAHIHGDSAIADMLRRFEEVLIPSVVLGELYYGAYRSSQASQNLQRVDALIVDCPVLVCDEVTAKVYGEIKKNLMAKGRPLPDNDIWIAATVLQHGAALATRDRHFGEIGDLKIEAV
jgi:tRNA(fMet)-specific endonuclease VapC